MDGALCCPLRVHAVSTAAWFPHLIYRAIGKTYFFLLLEAAEASLCFKTHLCP